MRSGAAAIAALLGVAAPAAAQQPKIMDNSFLIEEAYNQDPGVVQHISNLTTIGPGEKDLTYTFTQEWPVGGMTNQLSYTLPFFFPSGGPNEFGDILINYRYQVVDHDRVAFAPRASLTLPTGAWREGDGEGTVGLQLSAPVSIRVVPQVTMHLNAGATLLPGARGPTGARHDVGFSQLGASVIGPVLLPVNLMVECLALWSEAVDSSGAVVHNHDVILNPGFRFALNFGRLQVVPGLGVPIHLGEGGRPHDFFIYLSFEHPFMHVDEH